MTKQRGRRCYSVRLALEQLEAREVPATIVWTASSAGNWSTAGNWDLNRTPTSGDYVIFGSSGSNTNCTMDVNVTVDRVVMDSGYTATLTISSTKTLTTTNHFVQYGTLALSGSGTIDAGTYHDINGTVSLSGMLNLTGKLTTTGDIFINSGAVINSASAAGTLELNAGSTDFGGTINVGSGGITGTMLVVGAFNDASAAVINVGSSGGIRPVLTFVNGGSSSANPIIEGTMNLDHGIVNVDSTLGTHDGVLILDGGTLTTEFADDLIQANVWNTDGASITWTGSAYHNFTITGDYTLATSSTPQGALDMRIQYTMVPINDTLTVNGDIAYVTLDVNVVGNLPGSGGPITWNLITADTIDDNEVTVNFPAVPQGRTAWAYSIAATGPDEALSVTLT